MTPGERAEMFGKLWGLSESAIGSLICNIRAAVADESAKMQEISELRIRQAVEEAIMTEQMRQEQSEIEKIHRAVEEARSQCELAHQEIEVIKAEAYEEVLKSDSYRMNIWKAAQAKAYEDAAKIAEAADGWHPVGKEYANEVALAIRARAAEVSGNSRELLFPHNEDCKKKWEAGFPCAH